MRKNTLMKNVIAAFIVALTMTTYSCKKKGCTDVDAKNYDVEAGKDDGSCEHYSNTELLTMSAWKYSSLTTTAVDSVKQNYVDFFTNATATFKTGGTMDFVFPNEPSANETKTWEWTSDETSIILEKGLDKEDTLSIPTLTKDNCTFIFKDEDTGADVTVNWIH